MGALCNKSPEGIKSFVNSIIQTDVSAKLVDAIGKERKEKWACYTIN